MSLYLVLYQCVPQDEPIRPSSKIGCAVWDMRYSFSRKHSLENELATMTFAIDGFLPFALLPDLSSQADTSVAQDPLGASVGGT